VNRGYGDEAKAGEEEDEGYGKDWTIQSGKKCCQQGCIKMKYRKIDRGPTVRPDLGHLESMLVGCLQATPPARTPRRAIK